MGNRFKGSEIVELGIQIEKNGRDFYNTVAGVSGSPESRELFKYLAGEEEKHIAAFKAILDKLDKSKPPESYPGENAEYMKALASECIFTKGHQGEEIARRVTGDKQAIELGIRFEKDSIIFYVGLKDVVPSSEQGAVDKLITEEQKHLRKLSNLRKEIAR